jgi:hypothetical protein
MRKSKTSNLTKIPKNVFIIADRPRPIKVNCYFLFQNDCPKGNFQCKEDEKESDWFSESVLQNQSAITVKLDQK